MNTAWRLSRSFRVGVGLLPIPFLRVISGSGYINENGILNLERFEKFLASLSLREMDRFDDIYSDNKWLEGKTAKKKRTKSNGAKGASGFETIITDTPG
jgi:5'-3' exonuclease